MSLKLMFITNNSIIAKIMQEAGADRIFVDLERYGKIERQGHLNTVISSHSLADIISMRPFVTDSGLLVRLNPIHNESKQEIDSAIRNGADILMLPMIKTVVDVMEFVNYVDGRVKTCILIETKEAVVSLDDILDINGIDEAYIGLNDLHLSYAKKFMFELLTDGTVETLCGKLRRHGIPYGFGGIASMDGGLLPARIIIAEHYRLASSCVILSRSFWNKSYDDDLVFARQQINEDIKCIRAYEHYLKTVNDSFFIENQILAQDSVSKIVAALSENAI